VTELQQNRYDQLLRRVGDLKGQGSKVNDVLTELFPVLDVERVPGELLLLQGTRLCVGATVVNSGVGFSPRIQLFNPVDSGFIIALTQLWLAHDEVTTLRMAATFIALTTGVGTEVFRDRRLPIGARPVGQIRTQSSVAQTGANFQLRVQANTAAIVDDVNTLGVMPPGSGFEVGAAPTDSQLIATFIWRERVAEPSELNF